MTGPATPSPLLILSATPKLREEIVTRLPEIASSVAHPAVQPFAATATPPSNDWCLSVTDCSLIERPGNWAGPYPASRQAAEDARSER